MYDFNDSAKANVYPIETNAGYVYFNFFSKKKKKKIPGTGMSLD